ncbi:hypothetical protein MM326_13835 [Alkalihalobacillus sp. LMS6]|jgi:crossover junction endodeoxyribonuclease RuvC|uniref:hypothetical protein n=1 Tax=Alkalihalobacillus sp. LMS6 TaxID=2924034 RepID=UPI0020D0D2E2|nr:hypothetical protein [Alkalihalobacillus sp. LMS6]UTR05183.1 hypothetical protein MM326_13835 [Alkalihalobacillus sp. LMS6]
MTVKKTLRILAFDTSMKRPGVAIIEIKARRPRITALSHIAPESKRPHGHRAKIIEGWALTFLDRHVKTAGFDYITREDFSAKSSGTNYPVMAAWSACERAVNTFGLAFDKFEAPGKRPALGVGQSQVKRLVTGSGKAEKDEIAAAVRRYTGYTGEFAVDDESDAASIGLAFAINANLIDKITEGDGK